MQRLLDTVVSILSIAYYWIWIFWRAILATWSLVADRPIRSAAFTLLAAFVLVAIAAWGKKPVMQELRPWLVGGVTILMALFIVFVYELIVTPARVYEDQTRQIDKLNRRVSYAVANLPDRRLSDSERQKFKEIVAPFAQSVIIEYFEEPHSRSFMVADMLETIFQSAGWKVTLRKTTFDKIPIYGVALRISNSDLSDGQKAVLGAFQAVNIQCFPRGFAYVDVPDRRVELVVGEL
ncbi:MAG: hypothetical protein QOD80_714 [Verrucomicrobiota bacterium]|jgi:ABC-type multidrug transport system fused ATPase/permease subunit